jgi:hypothetical protein
VRGKSSFKRLSDVLGSGSSKKDMWFVVFNDVVLQCQRTGTTSLPLVAATNSRTNSLPELQGKAKYATTGRRNSHTRPRNLYKFIKVYSSILLSDLPSQIYSARLRLGRLGMLCNHVRVLSRWKSQSHFPSPLI